MLRNAIAVQETRDILAPSVAHSMTDYYAIFIALCIGVVVLTIIYGWWKDD